MRGRERCLFGFFSWKAWLLIVVMMGGGIVLRNSGAPTEALGVLYMAVGTALLYGDTGTGARRSLSAVRVRRLASRSVHEGDIMKVVAVNGSARRGGNTAMLLEAALAPLEAAGHECELIELAGKQIRGCTACGKCGVTLDRTCSGLSRRRQRGHRRDDGRRRAPPRLARRTSPTSPPR